MDRFLSNIKPIASLAVCIFAFFLLVSWGLHFPWLRQALFALALLVGTICLVAMVAFTVWQEKKANEATQPKVFSEAWYQQQRKEAEKANPTQ